MVYHIFSNRIVMAIISYVVFIISASAHEYFHARSAYRLGDKTAYSLGRLTLSPLAHIDILGTVILPLLAAFTGIPVIGWMKGVPVNPYNFKNPESGQAITSFAGPFANLLIATGAFTVIKVLTSSFFTGSPLIYTITEKLNISSSPIMHNALSIIVAFLWMFYLLNIMLMFFNLLPFPPLDGGWILRFFLPFKGKTMYDRIYPFGFLILYALLFFGVLRTILGFIQGVLISLIGSSALILFTF